MDTKKLYIFLGIFALIVIIHNCKTNERLTEMSSETPDQTKVMSKSELNARAMAREFIKEKYLIYPETATFNNNETSLELDTNKWHIQSTVTTKKVDGAFAEFEYKLNMQYMGGDLTKLSSWSTSDIWFLPK